MNCEKCEEKAVIILQHGPLCKTHFIHYFEEKVFKTINKFRLIERNDKICVATSGGKDSLTVLYLTKKYLTHYKIPSDHLFALCVDEGIENYRQHTIVDLQKFCKEHEVPLKVVTSKDEFGMPLDEAYPKINNDSKKKPCNVCGVFRRYMLNKYARQEGATKVVTGHNLDDEAQAIVMNLFKANTTLAGRLGPISGLHEQDGFVQRVKPLYQCSEKEVRLYTILKGFTIDYTECPYSQLGFRHKVQEMLNNFEKEFRGTKQGIIKSYLSMLPMLKEQDQQTHEHIKSCETCKEPSNKTICNACEMKEVLAQ